MQFDNLIHRARYIEHPEFGRLQIAITDNCDIANIPETALGTFKFGRDCWGIQLKQSNKMDMFFVLCHELGHASMVDSDIRCFWNEEPDSITSKWEEYIANQIAWKMVQAMRYPIWSLYYLLHSSADYWPDTESEKKNLDQFVDAGFAWVMQQLEIGG